jgi:hypothetical protein
MAAEMDTKIMEHMLYANIDIPYPPDDLPTLQQMPFMESYAY